MLKLKINQLLVVCTILMIQACGTQAVHTNQALAERQGPRLTQAKSHGLTFSTVDVRFSQSSVFHFDFQSGQIRQILAGQSGDPFLIGYEEQVFLFNRRPDFHNVVSFHPMQPNLSLKLQTSFPSEQGDPTAAAPLKNGHILLAFFNQGLLVEFNPQDGKIEQQISYTFADADTLLRPVDLLVQPSNDSNLIYVLHQGLNRKYEPNNSQAILVLEDTGSSLTWTSHHLPVKASYPQFLNQRSQQVVIAGLCYPGQRQCQTAIERLNLDSLELSTIVDDLSPLGIHSNGSIVSGFNDVSFFASVISQGPSAERKTVTRVDFTNPLKPEVEELYTYTAPNSRGAYLMNSAPEEGLLFIGDVKPDETGLLLIYQDQRKEFSEVSLADIPYQAIFLP